MWQFIAGLLLGGTIGALCMALVASGAHADRAAAIDDKFVNRETGALS